MSVIYTDYRFKFADIDRGVSGLQAMGAAGLFGSVGEMQALGDWRDASGAVVAQPFDDDGNPTAAWRGGTGTPAGNYTDASGQDVAVPARGDGSSWYVHIRSDVPRVSVDLADYGMTVSDADESAEVLGRWA